MAGYKKKKKKNLHLLGEFTRGTTTNNGTVSYIFSSHENKDLMSLYLTEKYFGVPSLSSCYPSLHTQAFLKTVGDCSDFS